MTAQQAGEMANYEILRYIQAASYTEWQVANEPAIKQEVDAVWNWYYSEYAGIEQSAS